MSITGEAGKSVQLEHGRTSALQSVVAALLPLDANAPLLLPLPFSLLNDSPLLAPPGEGWLEQAAAAIAAATPARASPERPRSASPVRWQECMTPR
jgi:hypothetical protein